MAPKFFEVVPRKYHVVVIVEEDVEFVIAGGILDADAGGSEIRGAGDDSAGLVLAAAVREKYVEFGVETFGRVGSDLDPFGRDIGDKLADAVFDILAVRAP